MARIVTWFGGTLTAVILLFGYHTSTSGPASTATSETVISGSSTTGSGSGDASGSGSGSGSTSGSGNSGSSTTTVTGAAAQTRYGPVQVQIVTDGSTISDVQVTQYPDSDRRDQQINSYALPILIDETIKAQSASVDMVSGATFTSMGYQESLQSALDQAGL